MRVGQEERPVAIVDNFVPDPDLLRDCACDACFEHARNLYPGVRAPLPDCYWSADLLAGLGDIFASEFGLHGTINLIDSSFSIVTTPRDRLQIGQRLPHPDAFRSNQMALVHYLSHDIEAGTNFYRHRSTGIEALNEALWNHYFSEIDREIRLNGAPDADYIAGDTEMFEVIGGVEARFNRAVLYRGCQLHSGAIERDTPLSPNQAEGRLTVTAFLTVD